MTEPTEIYIFSNFSAGGLHDWRILLVISLEFQEIRHQPFSMTQPKFYFNNLKLKYFFEIIKKINVPFGRIRMDAACPPQKTPCRHNE